MNLFRIDLADESDLAAPNHLDREALERHHTDTFIPWQSADSLSRSMIEDFQAERERMHASLENVRYEKTERSGLV
ncbi:MAG: hypothetical protein U0892_17000 [Pirellulales bacterium]